MKIKGTNWKRESTQKYTKGAYVIHLKRLICGAYWILYNDNLPLHIAKTAEECVLALETNTMSTSILGKPYCEFYDRWQNYFCYLYNFEKTSNINALRHKEFDIEIYYHHSEYQILEKDLVTDMIKVVDYSSKLDKFKEIVKRVMGDRK